ncbi:alpha-ketoglutarate-dependent dioxygenase alkB homolog 7, mitochondrial-like [Ciona intestinalis]
MAMSPAHHLLKFRHGCMLTVKCFRFPCVKHLTTFRTSNPKSKNLQKQASELLEYSQEENVKSIAAEHFSLFTNFITSEEETSLITEIDTKWRRLKYQKGHWDNAIQDYRELEIRDWRRPNASIIQRIQEVAFDDGDVKNNLIHVLDLSPIGFINPHVDSTRFCGRVIAGLSLLSPCVMKYTHKDDASIWFQALLPPKSLYIMRDRVRYEFEHEILKNEDSLFKGEKVNKSRRVSLLCRSQPQAELDEKPGQLFKPITLFENT